MIYGVILSINNGQSALRKGGLFIYDYNYINEILKNFLSSTTNLNSSE